MSKEYDIKTIGDFLKVPADRLEDCLAEFKMACDFVTSTMEVANISVDQLGKSDFHSFTWIDDGKQEKFLKLNLEEQK